MSFKQAVLNTKTEARTWNGMKAQKSTLDATVDLFFKIGASRGRDVSALFESAYQEDREVALRIAQWARDIRGGAGERKIFRDLLLHIEKYHKADLTNTDLLAKVPLIGRWDDLLVFTDPEVKDRAYSLIHTALAAGNGLCAKWMPRKGTKAVELRRAFGWTPKFYRKRLVELTNVVESQMCAKNWDEINFSHVPSLAMARYQAAFHKNAPDAFAAYKDALVKKTDPKVKVNASAVYPYDVIKSLQKGDTTVADAQWDALPDYMDGSNVLPVVDVSGSMMCSAGRTSSVSCLDVAVSLGLYLADKNKGDFKDMFLTFSTNPKFVHLRGTLSQKMAQMKRSEWQMSTNLHGAIDEVLRVAKANDVPASDMPSALLVLSDMQFNYCAKYDDSAMEMIRRKYEEAGYEVPAIIFWNLNAADNVPVSFNEKGVALVSGFSPSIMKAVLSADMDGMTPKGIMLKTVMSDRYALEAQ